MKIILAAGGSGGHIFPSLALASELKKAGVDDVQFVSSRRRLDMSLLGSSGYRCHFLSINPMPHGFDPIKLIVFCFKLIADIFASAGIILKERPDAVVGFGGYSSGTISLCAKLLGKPLAIHEQNFFPGRANVILSRMADLVAVTFRGTEKYLPGAEGKTVWTGNPLRVDMLSKDRKAASQRMGLASDKTTILVMGGSQGATFLNRTASEAVRIASEDKKGTVQVVHLTGKPDYDAMTAFYDKNGISARVFSFLDRMDDAYAMGDIAISRSGASAVFELAYYAMPMLLVPYPNPKNNQRTNARYFAERGAAVCKEEKELTAEGLASELGMMLSDADTMKKMSDAALNLAIPDAGKKFAVAIIELAKKRKGI